MEHIASVSTTVSALAVYWGHPPPEWGWGELPDTNNWRETIDPELEVRFDLYEDPSSAPDDDSRYPARAYVQWEADAPEVEVFEGTELSWADVPPGDLARQIAEGRLGGRRMGGVVGAADEARLVRALFEGHQVLPTLRKLAKGAPRLARQVGTGEQWRRLLEATEDDQQASQLLGLAPKMGLTAMDLVRFLGSERAVVRERAVEAIATMRKQELASQTEGRSM